MSGDRKAGKTDTRPLARSASAPSEKYGEKQRSYFRVLLNQYTARVGAGKERERLLTESEDFGSALLGRPPFRFSGPPR